jgi:hypothetical protein
MESYFERSFKISKERYSKEKKEPRLVPLIFGILS